MHNDLKALADIAKPSSDGESTSGGVVRQVLKPASVIPKGHTVAVYSEGLRPLQKLHRSEGIAPPP